MSGPISGAGEDVLAALRNFDPQNHAELEGVFPDLEQLFGGLASGLKGLADKFGDQLPVKPVVAEAIAEIAASLSGLSDATSEAHAAFRSAHADEISRIESPRPNEKIWDVSQQ